MIWLLLKLTPDLAVNVLEILYPEISSYNPGPHCDGPAGCRIYAPGDVRREPCMAGKCHFPRPYPVGQQVVK